MIQPRHTSSGFPATAYGPMFDAGLVSPTQAQRQTFVQMPVRPMYSSVQSVGRLQPTSSSAHKGGRVFQQIIHNNGSGNILFSSANVPVTQALHRRRVDYTNFIAQQQSNFVKAYQTPIFKQIEKEEVKNMYRNLKIQYNITRDENTRLRTQVKQMDVDLQKKEKEIENMTRSLQ